MARESSYVSGSEGFYMGTGALTSYFLLLTHSHSLISSIRMDVIIMIKYPKI